MQAGNLFPFMDQRKTDFLAFSARVKDCSTFSFKIKTTEQLCLTHLFYTPEQYQFISTLT